MHVKTLSTDALLTQVKVAEQVLAVYGDYVFIKENQPTLDADINRTYTVWAKGATHLLDLTRNLASKPVLECEIKCVAPDLRKS